jgi:hypothetical protein
MLELAKWWQAKIESKTGLMLNTRFGFMYVCLVSQDALAIVSFDQIGRTKPLLVDGNFYPFQHNFLEKMLWAIAHEQASLFSLRTFMRELMLWSSLPVSELEAKIKVPYLNSVEGCGEKLVIEEAVAFFDQSRPEYFLSLAGSY